MQQHSGKKWKKQLWLPIVASLAWICFTAGLYRQAVNVDAEHRLELEHTRLSTMARQLMDARNWNAVHGGVYVPESEYGKPNPWLPENERTITTHNGRTLVLMNPAYMSRQLAERSSEPGVSISIISNRPLRAENLADQWEKSALTQCTENAHEIFSAPDGGHGGKLRLLSVLIAQQSCLRCHTGRKVGEVLGGISVSQDAEPFLKNMAQQRGNMRLLYGLLCITGILAIGGLTLNLTRRRLLAEETSRVKSAFMGRLSHDMRTPLTAIVGMSELLQQKNVSEQEKAKAVRYLTQAGTALLEMVRDITDHAALEQAEPELECAPFSLRQCLADCIELYRPVAENKGINLELTVETQAPDCVRGDAFRLRQALGNLVSNAVKFTESGGVNVRAWMEKTESGRLWLRVAVQDTGPGLAAEEQARIFESFQRGRGAAELPGTGLGLSIARTLANLMGGDITLVSEAGHGASFTLEVVLQQAEADAHGVTPCMAKTAPDGDEASPPLINKKVLVAEDTAANCYVLQQLLEQMGALVSLAENGEAALAMLREPGRLFWDLVILDDRMPGKSGLEVLEAIRNGETRASKRQKAIIYSAAVDASLLRRAEALGADAVLSKPLSFEQLRHELKKVFGAETGKGGAALGKKSSHGNIAAESAETSVCGGTGSSVWNRTAALDAVDNDENLLNCLVEVLRKDLRERGAEMDEAVVAGEAEKLRRMAHACKNSAGVMCLGPLREAAEKAEKAADQDLLQKVADMRAAMKQALRVLELNPV